MASFVHAFAVTSRARTNYRRRSSPCTVEARTFEATDWDQIVDLYDHLFSFIPTPMVALNRAIAIGESGGSGAGLAALDQIGPDLNDYHLMHAAHGTMLSRVAQKDGARAALERAADLAVTKADRSVLALQIGELADN